MEGCAHCLTHQYIRVEIFLLKSVKMHFSGNTEILGFEKSPPIFLWGSEFISF